MLRAAHTSALARLAAVIVAASLSGAPRVLALHAPVEAHRCSCRAHGGGHHECDCAICRKAALSARAADDGQPPCHRAAARKALSADDRRGAPCVEGTCGNAGRPLQAGGEPEPFRLPEPGVVAPILLAEALPEPTAVVPGRAIDPPAPRPRSA